MAHVPEVVLDLYPEVPRECFVAGVPSELEGFEDNDVVPFGWTLSSPDGSPCKWLRFCDFLPFLDACRVYWMECCELRLHVCVMPYTPLRDAFYLYEIITNRDQIPQGDSPYVDQGGADPQQRDGLAEVSDGISLKFTVTNYNLLRSKAEHYYTLSLASNALRECQQKLDVTRGIIHLIPRKVPSAQALVDARNRFILLLLEGYGEGSVQEMDLHSALISIFPEMHDQVYENPCHHCHPDIYPIEFEDSTTTRVELNAALQRLQDEEVNVNQHLSIRQAKFSLMSIEGSLEFDTFIEDSRAKFLESRDTINTAIRPTVDYVHQVTTGHSLMGV